MNLYDLTRGNYRVVRAVSYPDFPESLILFDVRVAVAAESEWVTDVFINGMYNGPTDIIASNNYKLTWVADGPKLLEMGSASLELSSGKHMRQVWSSIITPEQGSDGARRLAKFPSVGEVITAKISPFKLDGNSMSYDWEGTVRKGADAVS
jgi:hypothetical protein